MGFIAPVQFQVAGMAHYVLVYSGLELLMQFEGELTIRKV